MGGKAEHGRRVPRDEALLIVEQLRNDLGSLVARFEAAGSLRRGKPDCGDIDIVVLPADYEKLNEKLKSMFGPLKTKPDTAKKSGLLAGVQVEVLIASEASWGAAMITATGSGKWNVIQRGQAKRMGYLLNEKGLWVRQLVREKSGKIKIVSGEFVAGSTEEGVYSALDMDFKEPCDREV